MIRYFEKHDCDYITIFGKAAFGGITINEERYNALMQAVDNAPEDTETTTYRLKTDLTWEEFSIEPVDPELTDGEALSILLGGEVS